MKVFVVLGFYDYEGGTVLDVFASREVAEIYIWIKQKQLRFWEKYDHYEIIEKAIQE